MKHFKIDEEVFYIMIVNKEPRVFKGVITDMMLYSFLTIDSKYEVCINQTFRIKDEAISKAKEMAEESKKQELAKWDRIINNIDFTDV